MEGCLADDYFRLIRVFVFLCHRGFICSVWNGDFQRFATFCWVNSSLLVWFQETTETVSKVLMKISEKLEHEYIMYTPDESLEPLKPVIIKPDNNDAAFLFTANEVWICNVHRAWTPSLTQWLLGWVWAAVSSPDLGFTSYFFHSYWEFLSVIVFSKWTRGDGQQWDMPVFIVYSPFFNVGFAQPDNAANISRMKETFFATFAHWRTPLNAYSQPLW